MKNIYLVGFMGTGKSAVGRKLANKIESKFVDLDHFIEKEQGRTIKDIFSRNGEFYFRTLEKEAVKEVCGLESVVIACGGGVVLDDENMQNLKGSGIVICLNSRPEVILKRCKGHAHRPLLNVDNPLLRIKELLSFRAPFYAKAQFSIDTSDLTVEESVEEIYKQINKL
ncbi:MAG: shikimate kinase [Candidatus Omnitrophica bacterium]|nr:shikimate kinase [Candidatus Omnitrophota bacterium]